MRHPAESDACFMIEAVAESDACFMIEAVEAIVPSYSGLTDPLEASFV